LQGRAVLSGPVLLTHGWIDGYDALYRRSDSPSIEVGDLADRFQTASGAHWWYGVSLLRVPSGYGVVAMPRVGAESTGVQSQAFVGIIFRQGEDVVDVYVSLRAPAARTAVLALARLVDRRLAGTRVAAVRTTSHPASPPRTTAWVYPNPLPSGSYPTVNARTVPGAVCTAHLTLSNGQAPTVYPRNVRTADRTGRVSWFWHQVDRASRGTAQITCAVRHRTLRAAASFRVTS
jgi:hypothetical protein